MDTIKIGTLNMQNNKVNRMGGVYKNSIDNVKTIVEHIEKGAYYFIGTQELTRLISERLNVNLKNYRLYGNYRYGSSNFIKHVKVIDSYNENNAIITAKNVNFIETDLLPWVPTNPKDLFEGLKYGSIMPRIVTIAKIRDEQMGDIFAVNTHLDYQLKNIQIKQLKILYNIVENLIYFAPVVLTGDFNMEVGVDNQFDDFIAALSKLGLKRVEVNDKTNAEKFSNKTAIDHIFVPRNWQIIDAGLISDKNLKTVTDHKGIYTKVKVK